MAWDGKGTVGGMGRPALINPGGLLPFKAGAELALLPKLTAPGTGPSPLQGQRASCPPSPFRQVPKPPLQPRQPSKVSLLTFCPTVPARPLCPGSSPADLPISHCIPPLAITRKRSQLPQSQEPPLPPLTDGEKGPETGRVLLEVIQQSHGRARIRS